MSSVVIKIFPFWANFVDEIFSFFPQVGLIRQEKWYYKHKNCNKFGAIDGKGTKRKTIAYFTDYGNHR